MEDGERKLLGCAVITIRRCSGKYTWTEHETPEQAYRSIRNQNQGHYFGRGGPGRRWKFRYKVNVYLKKGIENG